MAKTNCLLAKGMPRFQPGLLEDNGQRAESGNRRLKKINTYKTRKKQPVWTVDHGKNYAEKNKTAGKRQNNTI